MTEIIKQIDLKLSEIADIIKILPEQGYIEIQSDSPGKVHDWHRHPNEETLIVLRGQMTFSLENGDHVCDPGDALQLSANHLHKSTAGPQGSVYLIAFRRLVL